MYEYIFVYIVLPLIIIKIINFFVGNIFSIFFSCTYILDKVVSSLYANFGTPVCISRPRNHLTYYCGQKKWDIKFLSVLKNSM
jgi:hypothetical protein